MMATKRDKDGMHLIKSVKFHFVLFAILLKACFVDGNLECKFYTFIRPNLKQLPGPLASV
jgi:hypothetical protein